MIIRIIRGVLGTFGFVLMISAYFALVNSWHILRERGGSEVDFLFGFSIAVFVVGWVLATFVTPASAAVSWILSGLAAMFALLAALGSFERSTGAFEPTLAPTQWLCALLVVLSAGYVLWRSKNVGKTTG